MNIATPRGHLASDKIEKVRIGHTACPHDCPSVCALDVDILSDGSVGRVRGAKLVDHVSLTASR